MTELQIRDGTKPTVKHGRPRIIAATETSMRCTKCMEWKSHEGFRTGLSRAGKLYRHRSCKTCQSKAAISFARAHRPVVNARQNARYHERKGDPDYIERKRELSREAARKDRARPGRLETIREQERVRRLSNIPRYLVRGARARAAERGLAFDIDEQWAADRYSLGCELTGIAFRPTSRKKTVYSASIERIDPVRGYVRDNCRLILMGVNALKQDGSDAEMFEIARALLSHSSLKV